VLLVAVRTAVTRWQPQAGDNGEPRGQSACRDTKVGQNASHPQTGVGYQAQVGYDAVTGWGVPDGVALLNAL
jgi:kumamolisin